MDLVYSVYRQGCQVEEVRVGWTRGKKDRKMLLAILPGGKVIARSMMYIEPKHLGS